jgi:5-formyltetrahydrofolate cyclo-ligase
LATDGLKTKAELRTHFLEARSRLSPTERMEKSRLASLALAASETFANAKRVALYAAIRAEADPVDLEALALARGAEVTYPRVVADGLELRLARRGELRPAGPYAIPEPSEDQPTAAITSIDLFVVPGVAFSRTGDRLGYGKGYYDRLLRFVRANSEGRQRQALAIGFAFACQVSATLPRSVNDEPVDGIATEEGLVVVRVQSLY